MLSGSSSLLTPLVGKEGGQLHDSNQFISHRLFVCFMVDELIGKRDLGCPAPVIILGVGEVAGSEGGLARVTPCQRPLVEVQSHLNQ